MKTKQALSIDVRTLANKVYGIDLDKYTDPELYDVYSEDVYMDNDDKDRFMKLSKELYPNNNNLNHTPDESISELTQFAMTSQLEKSLINETYINAVNLVVKDLEQGFYDVNNSVMYDDIQFDIVNEDITIDEQLKVIGQNFETHYDEINNRIVFTGSYQKLAYTLIAALNGHGMFTYGSLNEFCDIDESEDLNDDILIKTIINHIQWLGEWHNIYHDGTFSLNSDKLANALGYMNLGGTYIDKDDVEYAWSTLSI